jgi:hypothetical protein
MLISNDLALLNRTLTTLSDNPHVAYAMILDEKGTILTSTKSEEIFTVPQDEISLRAQATQDVTYQYTNESKPNPLLDVSMALFSREQKRFILRVGFYQEKETTLILLMHRLKLLILLIGVGLLMFGIPCILLPAWIIVKGGTRELSPNKHDILTSLASSKPDVVKELSNLSSLSKGKSKTIPQIKPESNKETPQVIEKPSTKDPHRSGDDIMPAGSRVLAAVIPPQVVKNKRGVHEEGPAVLSQQNGEIHESLIEHKQELVKKEKEDIFDALDKENEPTIAPVVPEMAFDEAQQMQTPHKLVFDTSPMQEPATDPKDIIEEEDELPVERSVLPDLGPDMIIRKTGLLRNKMSALNLREKTVVNAIAFSSSIKQIVQSSTLEEKETYQVLASLIDRRLLQIVKNP